MSRIKKLEPAVLNDEQRAIYDGIAGGKRAAGPQLFRLTDDDKCLNGPFNALLYSPTVGAALSKVGEAIRFGSDIPMRDREIAILVIAQEYQSEFEWYAHAAIGRHVELSEEILAALRDGETPDFDIESERKLYEFCVQVVRTRKVEEGLYQEVKALIDERGILELVALLGYYTSLALIMNVFEIGVPDGVDTVFDK